MSQCSSDADCPAGSTVALGDGICHCVCLSVCLSVCLMTRLICCYYPRRSSVEVLFSAESVCLILNTWIDALEACVCVSGPVTS